MVNNIQEPRSSSSAPDFFSAPLWQSAFRPFYLLGVSHGLLVMALWTLMYLGMIDFTSPPVSLSLWHGHEMIFGFSGAILSGFVLTALPGWAGTAEMDRGRLALLVGLWLFGRIAFHSSSLIPAPLVILLDCSLFPVLAMLVSPGLLRARNKYYLLLLPILALLFLGNLVFHLALNDGDMARASWGIRLGLMAIVALFILAGGFLTTVFTGNALRQKGGPAVAVNPALEYLAAFSLAGFIWAVLGNPPALVAAGLAFLAALVQGWRFLRWRTWRLLDAPLVVTLHLAYAWFVVALVLFGVAALTPAVSPLAWLHAFTVGALSLMMLSLITRVTLRHTGRSLTPARLMILAFGLMGVCALLRLLVSLDILGPVWLPATALIWGGSFAIYLAVHGRHMILPSLPKKPRGEKRAAEIPTLPS